MKPVKYPESIFCDVCSEHVQMVDCRISEPVAKKPIHIDFDYVCVSCGHRASASRNWEFLQFSEREFCQKSGVGSFGSKDRGKSVINLRPTPK